MGERQRVSNHHQVTPRPTRDHHAHRNRHPLRAEHGPHDRRHRREEAPVRAPIRRHEEDQRAQGVRHGPHDDHAERREQQGYEQRVEGAQGVSGDAGAESADGGGDVEACYEAGAGVGREAEGGAVERDEEGGNEEGEGGDDADEEDGGEFEVAEEMPVEVGVSWLQVLEREKAKGSGPFNEGIRSYWAPLCDEHGCCSTCHPCHDTKDSEGPGWTKVPYDGVHGDADYCTTHATARTHDPVG